MNSQNNITKKSKRYGEKVWIKLEFNIIALTVISALCSPLDFWPPLLYSMQTKSTCVCSEWRPRDCAFAQPIGASSWSIGGTFCFSACVLLKSWNQPWNRDFSQFHPILTISPIFDFFKRFSTQSMFWLVKSYDFTSQNAILTTLV